jgi:hypothetical protein
MAKVQLKVPSWIASKLGFDCTGWFTLEQEVKEGTSVADFLTIVATAYPGFREAVYNPGAGSVTEQISLVLNERLLTVRDLSQVKLTDGDTITVFPMYFGG